MIKYSTLLYVLIITIFFSCKHTKVEPKATPPKLQITSGTLIIKIPVLEITPWDIDSKLEGLFSLPSLSNVEIKGYPPEPQIEFIPDSYRVKIFGLTNSQVHEKYRTILRSDTVIQNIKDLMSLTIEAADGKIIPFSAIGEFNTIAPPFEKITHNGEQVLEASMQFSGKPIGTVIDSLERHFEKRDYRGYGQYSSNGKSWHSFEINVE